ncbi:glyoxalase superfamily protein [Halomonas urumqiensis]|uniref:glyoxalase superfamily protein n=1 Tax=Halomonas urumqiensis TaxID=1684789 RepID=UPI001E320905|nr:glyoxalase superfamily protein [Halomonas urumqiensis]
MNTDALEALHRELLSHGDRYCRPEITTAPWGDRVFEVVDPFSNRLLFNECTST